MKRIILFLLFCIPLFSQSSLIRRTELGDSTSALRNAINDLLVVAKTVDGWYAQDITTGGGILKLSRGVGEMDNEFDLMSPTKLSRIGARINNAEVFGEINVHLYKNDQPTGAFVSLGNYITKTSQSFSNVTFNDGDYFDLRYEYTTEQIGRTPDIKAYVELSPYGAEYRPSDSYTITTTAVPFGTIVNRKIVNGVVTESNVTTAAFGDSILFVASGLDTTWHFWCWTGISLANSSDRVNDSIRVLVTDDINIRARFHREYQSAQIRVVINQPDGNTDIGNKMKWMFVAGYDDTGNWDNWANYDGAGDSVHVIYKSNIEDAYKFCDSVGAEILIEGMYNSRVRGQTLAQTYYPIQSMFPAGGRDSLDMDSTYQYWDSNYPKSEFPAAWIFGATWYEQNPGALNRSAYDCEFLGYSPGVYQGGDGGYWYNIITGLITEPQARYAPAWSAGLIVRLMDEWAVAYQKTDGWKDYYGIRMMHRYRMSDRYDSEFNTWTPANGYNMIDYGVTFEYDRNVGYQNKCQNNEYYFRDTDIYLQR